MGVYSRFGGKDGVVEELYKEGVERLFAAWASAKPTTRWTTSGAAASSYRTNALANGTHYMVVFGGGGSRLRADATRRI